MSRKYRLCTRTTDNTMVTPAKGRGDIPEMSPRGLFPAADASTPRTAERKRAKQTRLALACVQA